jgi:methyl-accepting chemotaxis protein
MDEVVGSVNRVTDIMAEITSASREQSVGIDQINQAESLMDEATQQNAALVEEAAAAAESLRDQASGLVEVVSVFKLNAPLQNPGPVDIPSGIRAPFANPSQRKAKLGYRPSATSAATRQPDPEPEWQEF